eukprot:789699-Alexandrium_andersonii.AAC.1
MSASLVGSEMCIRDRLLTALESHGELRKDPESEGYLRSGPQSLGEIPVSYTHLTLPTICSV